MKNTAEAIGSRYALGIALAAIGFIQLVLIGISFIQCRLCRNAPLFLITMASQLPITFLLGGFCLFTMAYLLGRNAGRQIITNKQPFWWTGSMTALATFILVTCMIVLIGSFEMAWNMNGHFKGALEGIFPALLTLLMIGMYPATGLGMIYRGLLKRNSKNQT